MKIRFSPWAFSLLMVCSAGAHAGLLSGKANIASCKAVVQADPKWLAVPGYEFTYTSSNFDATRVFVEAKVEQTHSGPIAHFFAFQKTPKKGAPLPPPEKAASAECRFNGAQLISWQWVKIVPEEKKPETEND